MCSGLAFGRECLTDVCWGWRCLGVDSPILTLRGRSFKTGRARSEVHRDKCDGATHIPVFSWSRLGEPRAHAAGAVVLWSCRPLTGRQLLSRTELEVSVSTVSGEVHHPVGLARGFVEAPLVSFLLLGISSPAISPFSLCAHSESHSHL